MTKPAGIATIGRLPPQASVQRQDRIVLDHAYMAEFHDTKRMRYCSHCGTMLVQNVKHTGFNTSTGKPEHNLVWRCPNRVFGIGFFRHDKILTDKWGKEIYSGSYD